MNRHRVTLTYFSAQVSIKDHHVPLGFIWHIESWEQKFAKWSRFFANWSLFPYSAWKIIFPRTEKAWSHTVWLETSLFADIFYGIHWLCKWSTKTSLWKHAYSNILKILPPKKWKFSDKNSDVFHISAQNIDCGYSLEPPRHIDWSIESLRLPLHSSR